MTVRISAVNVVQTRIIMYSYLVIWRRSISPDATRDNTSVAVVMIDFVCFWVWLLMAWISSIEASWPLSCWRVLSAIFPNSSRAGNWCRNCVLISCCGSGDVSTWSLISSSSSWCANILLERLDARWSLSSSVAGIEATACVIRRRLMVATWLARADLSCMTSSLNMILNYILRGRHFDPLFAMWDAPWRLSKLKILSRKSRSGLWQARAAARMDMS